MRSSGKKAVNYRPRVKTEYLKDVYKPRLYLNTINEAFAALAAFNEHRPFDSIAFTGTSGAAVAYPLSFLLGKRLTCIRKEDEDSHFRVFARGKRVEGCVNPRRYVIVDDCICSGNTVRSIEKAIKEVSPGAKLIGIYLYSDAYTTRCGLWRDTPVIPHVHMKNAPKRRPLAGSVA